MLPDDSKGKSRNSGLYKNNIEILQKAIIAHTNKHTHILYTVYIYCVYIYIYIYINKTLIYIYKTQSYYSKTVADLFILIYNFMAVLQM